MLTLQENKSDGTFRVCLRESGHSHCTTVGSIKEAYAAQAALKRAVESGKMQIVDAMDLFEQSRTETVGGQQGLKAFLDRGLALVVGQIDELVLAEGVALGAGVNVRCEVTLIRETTERRCFHFQQRLLRADGAEVARVRVLMCCVDQSAGALARVPDESWEEWKRIMGELEAGGVGSVAITPATAAAM